jgi:outer membrane protein TolC
MTRSLPRVIRIGAALSVIVALLAFLVRAAEAQEATPKRLSLGDAARLAAQQSAGVESAHDRVKQAEARVLARRADLLPNLSAATAFTRHTVNSASFGFDFPTPAGQPPLLDPNGQIIGPVKLLDARGRVTQSVLDYGVRGRIRAAQAGVSVANADVAIAAEQAASVAAAAYLRVLRSDAQLRARIADSTLACELLSIAQNQLHAGVGVALDVTRAESQLAGVRAQLIAARNDRNRARLDLARALSLTLDAPITLTDSLGAMPTVASVDEQAVTERALANRPELRVVNEQLRAAESQVAAIRAERLPSVAVFGDDGVIGKNTEHLLATYQMGLQVSIPVFDGRRREARVLEQEAMVHDIDVRRRDLRLQIAADVRAAVLDLASAREQVDAAGERLRLAEQELAQARDRFRAGVAGNADVITASLSLNSARNLLIDAQTAYQSARVALARAEGSVTSLQ